MKSDSALAIFAGVALFVVAQATAQASIEASGNDYPGQLPDNSAGVDPMATLDQKVYALTAVIRAYESHDQYNVLYGGAKFTDFSRHPWEGKPLPPHSAAGAYQIIISTWEPIKNRLKLPDFSPDSQDLAAIELLRQRGAIDALDNGNIEQAMQRASLEWASLPYSKSGQPKHTLASALADYTAALADEIA